MTDKTDLVHAIAMETGIGHLTVFCAITPCYEGRAVRAVGRAKVLWIQWRASCPKRRGSAATDITRKAAEVDLEEVFG